MKPKSTVPLITSVVACILVTRAHATEYTWGGGNGYWKDTNWYPAGDGAAVIGTSVTGSTNTASISGAVTVEGNWKTFGNLSTLTVSSGAKLNFYNYYPAGTATDQTISNLVLAGGTITASYNTGNFGASYIRRVTVTGTSTSTISSGADPNGYFNLRDITDGSVSPFFDVQDAAGILNVTARLADRAASTTTWTSTGFEKKGAGTMILSNTNTYTGATTITAGKLVIDGNISTSTTTVKTTGTLGGSGTVGAVIVQDGGTLAPGNSIDSLDIAGALTLGAGSFSLFEINTAGDISDLVVVSGLLTFGGTLNVNNMGATLVNGDTFDLFNWGGRSGTFSAVSLPTLDSGLTWDQSQLYTDGTLTVVPETRAALLGSLGLLALLRRRR